MLNFRQLMFDKNLTQRDLAKIMGIDQPAVSGIMNGRKDLRKRHIDALVAYYGEEEVRKYEISDEDFFSSISRPAQITFYPSQVVEDVREDVREEIMAEEIPAPVIVPTEIMGRPEVDTKKWIETKEAQSNADRLQIAEILRATDMVWRVDDEAMRPTLFQGEYVLIKEMDDEAQIIDGRVYAFDTVYHGNLIRRVYDDGDAYRLEPINKDGFASIVVDKGNGMNRRYKILCHLSTDISMMPDIEGERARQDRLIDMVNRSGDRVDRLLSMLEKKME